MGGDAGGDRARTAARHPRRSGTRRPRPTSCPPTAAGSCGPSRWVRSQVSRSPRSCRPMVRSWSRTLSIGLDLPRDVLDRRIRDRVRRMFDDGLVEEVKGLLARGLRDGRTASRALGYPQVIDLLDGATRTGRGRGGHRAGDPPLRPPPAALVPSRSADHLAGRDGPSVVHSFVDRGPHGRACP